MLFRSDARVVPERLARAELVEVAGDLRASGEVERDSGARDDVRDGGAERDDGRLRATRVERDRELVRETAVASVLNDLLPILDDLDRAREHNEFDGAFKTVGEALESTVARVGLERFGEAGVAFDPAEHEALTHESRDDVDGPTVVTVYQPGYRFAGRVLRPARVAVADN